MRRTPWMLVMGAIVTCATAAERITTPSASDPARAAVLQAAHRSVDVALRQPVRFVVERMHTDGEWTFVLARMQRQDGTAIDYARTRHAEAARHGGMSQEYAAVLRRVDGAWRIEAEAIGPTDPAWLTWPEQVGAPTALFDE